VKFKNKRPQVWFVQLGDAVGWNKKIYPSSGLFHRH
jgi:hypothetical protein